MSARVLGSLDEPSLSRHHDVIHRRLWNSRLILQCVYCEYCFTPTFGPIGVARNIRNVIETHGYMPHVFMVSVPLQCFLPVP